MSESAEELNTLPDFERWETFWVGGQRVGALHRVWQDSVLLTRIAIEDESGDYLAESRIRFVPGPDWDLSWFHSSGMDEPVLLHNPANWTHTGSLPVVTAESLTALDGRELPTGVSRQAPAGTVPGYGEFLVLQNLIGRGLLEASWRSIHDDDGQVQQTKMVAVADQQPPEYVSAPLTGGPTLRYDRFDDDQRAASHWSVDGAILASEWGGAYSLRVADESGSAAWESIAGLQESTARFLLHGTRP
ncbi:hypothetical protein [Arthrobacter rhombi]|uniref:hypothetical protein n=1 Tax=Arthrobacter rhombi TaxID=71253 RepID=UPI003F922EA7